MSQEFSPEQLERIGRFLAAVAEWSALQAMMPEPQNQNAEPVACLQSSTI